MKMATAQNNSKRGAGVFMNWSSKYSGGIHPSEWCFVSGAGTKLVAISCIWLFSVPILSPSKREQQPGSHQRPYNYAANDLTFAGFTGPNRK